MTASLQLHAEAIFTGYDDGTSRTLRIRMRICETPRVWNRHVFATTTENSSVWPTTVALKQTIIMILFNNIFLHNLKWTCERWSLAKFATRMFYLIPTCFHMFISIVLVRDSSFSFARRQSVRIHKTYSVSIVNSRCACPLFMLILHLVLPFSACIYLYGFTFSRVHNQAKKPLRRVRVNIINCHLFILFFFNIRATPTTTMRLSPAVANIDININNN